VSPEKLIGYVRDAGCVLLGLGGIAFQIYTGNMSAVGMGTCMVLLGYTGGINARQVVRQLQQATSLPGGRGPSSRSSRSGSPSPSAPSSEAEP
jgi:hypothetical protein